MTRAWEATGDIEHVCLTPWSQYLNEPNLAGVTFANGEMLLDRTKDFPKTREELNAFDVVIISDVPEGNFSKEQMEWVVDWVKNRGGGFLMGGGNTAFDSGKYDKTPWEQIVPVDMVSYGDGNLREWFEIDIPKSVRNHPLWTVSLDPKANEKILAAHPRFTGMNLVRRAKPGALVLATRRGTGDPVIAAQRYGRGRAVAFMPDPNGGGGTFYIEWGTEGSPIMGANFRQMELGHGKGFRFNKESAETDYGPEPEYPSKWYGQYWVNMVRWLGENSVRWQRDKLAGRVVAAQARPGERLAVAAEVLAVSQIDELLALDVGARLEGTGSRRVRLLYDRDRREFTGDLLVPSDLGEKTEVIVLFDVEVKNQTLSQSVSTGIYRGNPEFSESAPDPVFLSDLAKATGGSVLENPGDAADSIREAAEKRLSEARRSWSEPLWSRGWPWLIFAICFCLEWTLRRLGSRVQADPIPVPSAAILIGFLLVTTGISAEVDQTSKLTEEWIAQLGADRVRLRDEADRHLREDPDSYGALVAFSGETKNGEAKARAENILRHFKSHRWHLVAIRNGGLTQLDKGNTISRGLIVSPQKTRLYSRERGFARVWNAVTYEPLETFGEPSYSVKDGRLTAGIATALAISADSKRIAATNEFGETIIYDPKSFMEVRRFSEVTAKAFVELGKPNLKGAILSLQFLSDNRKLLAGTAAGVRLWDSDTGKLMWKTESTEPAFSMVTTPDRTKLIYCGDSPRANDQLYTVDLQSGKMLLKMEAPTRLGGLQFNSTGKKLLGFGQDGFARVFDFDSQTSELSNERSYGPNSNECQGAAWGPDETTVLTTSWNPKQPVIEWDLETGEPVWKSPPMEVGLCTPAWIDRERIAILGEEGVLTIWKYTGG
ncbi:MAG: hypothetical protein KA152_01215 [Verrucomicrobiales bacterium]|nr:hypothetical protein [Verrucomicrobiales bacterium]